MRIASRRLGVAAFIWAAGVAPVAASTLPPLSVTPGRGLVSVGLFDASVDFGVLPGLTAGLSYTGVPLAPVVAARATTSLGEGPFGVGLGATMSVGASGTTSGRGATTYTFWAQPALNVSVPVGAGAHFRATVGPVAQVREGGLQPPAVWTDWVWPNMELVVPMDATSAVTVGGNSLFGWRGSF